MDLDEFRYLSSRSPSRCPNVSDERNLPGERRVTNPIMLIVEDEALIRMCAVDFAEEAGYDTLEARNAREALAALETRDDITVLFTDISLGEGMNGLELIDIVHDRWPHIRVLLASGTAPEDAASVQYLPKPYGATQFLDAVQVLAAS